MSKERFESFIDEFDEFDWYIKDKISGEQFEYLEDITKFLNQQDQKIADLEAKLAESEKKLNQYPYKNDVIEKQYNELKQCIEYLPSTEDKTQSSFIYSICNNWCN